jgi:hypothetical protein
MNKQKKQEFVKMKELLNKINEEPFVSGEGEKLFNTNDFEKLRNIVEEINNNPKKILSINEKCLISNYIYYGKITLDLEKESFLPATINRKTFDYIHYGLESVLGSYCGKCKSCYKQNGCDLFILDIDEFEEKLNNKIMNFADGKSTGSTHWKSGKVAKLLFKDCDFKRILDIS